MKKWISGRTAGIVLLTYMALWIIYHGLVLLGILSVKIEWAYRLNDSPEHILVWETIAFIVKLCFLILILIKLMLMKADKDTPVISPWLGLSLLCYFIGNIYGHLASGVSVEDLVIIPVDLFLVVLSFKLMISH